MTDRHPGAPLRFGWDPGCALSLVLAVTALSVIVLRIRSVRQLHQAGAIVDTADWAPQWLLDAADSVDLAYLVHQLGDVQSIQFVGEPPRTDDEIRSIICRFIPDVTAFNTPEETAALLKKLSCFPQLTELHIGYCPLSSVGLPHLAKLHRLELLLLYDTSLDDTGLEHLEKLHALRYLALTNADVTNRGVERLPLERLQWLFLSETKLSDAPIRRFSEARQLWCLHAERTDVGDAFVSGLANCDELASVWMGHTRITNHGVESLARLPLRQLGLAYTAIDHRGLSTLENCPLLTTLELDASQITSESIAALEKFPALEELTIAKGFDDVTDELAIKELRESFPYLNIQLK